MNKTGFTINLLQKINSNSFFKSENLSSNNWLKPRLAVQSVFFIAVLLIGYRFIKFVETVRAGDVSGSIPKPPGVEGFLPISSLMELWLFIKSGILINIHPAGVVIIGFAIISAVLLRRGFCSWFCPVGTLSEMIFRLGVKLNMTWNPNKWFDIPFRIVKYFLLAFFLYAILGMPTAALIEFLRGDYNVVSDIKMMDFFAPPSRFTISVLLLLAFLTMIIKHFWCRYLCPYGALLGIFSLISPMKIRRDSETCIDCGICDEACPSYLPVATKHQIKSAECLACHQCTAVCPVSDCLTLSSKKPSFSLGTVKYGIIFLLLYMLAINGAKIADYWRSEVDIKRIAELSNKTGELTHPRNIGDY